MNSWELINSEVQVTVSQMMHAGKTMQLQNDKIIFSPMRALQALLVQISAERRGITAQICVHSHIYLKMKAWVCHTITDQFCLF
jgi:hypothetical protein